ncbi:hydroxyacid dehydrogenase [Phaeacidiphilus oryzae]|uniref:hydroxyacid dehydrogenase n=1 Tax=Phaeacidiphilus oryzae TaxID=348818 RepID=UPI000690B51B
MRGEVFGQLFPPTELARLRELVELTSEEALSGFGTPEARKALGEAELLITGWGCPPVDAEALAAAPRLRAVVHVAGTVRNHITEACWERGLRVSTAAAANGVPVAEYTLAMILLSQKRVLESARALRTEHRRPAWTADPRLGNFRRTVGILSASGIGRRVIGLLRPHDLEVLLHDPFVSPEEAERLGARAVGIEELFAVSDTVSVHTPLLPQTVGLVSRELLALMPDGATLINTARGAVVDQEALTAELLSGRLRAVLDVTVPDPLPPGSPLYGCPNVLLTPHVAGSLGGELLRMTELALGEIERLARGEEFAHRIRREDLGRTA